MTLRELESVATDVKYAIRQLRLHHDVRRTLDALDHAEEIFERAETDAACDRLALVYLAAETAREFSR